MGRREAIEKLRSGRIRSRRGAVAAILCLQAVVLAVGWFFTFTRVRHATAEAVEGIVLGENVRIADWLASQLAPDAAAPLAYGSVAWERVQTRIETLQLPGDGFASLLDADGRILCHPDLRRDPALRQRSLGAVSLSPSDGGEPLPIADAPRAETLAGRISFGLGGTHYVATRYVPRLGARLIVHQPASGLVHLSSRATVVVGVVAASAALSVLGLTALVTLWVMRRYESALERINRGLEDEVDRRTQQNLAARDALIMGLAKLADCRDSETGLHLERISEYSALLASQLAATHPEIDDAWIDRLRLASGMHDIGKVGLPDDILLKPGPLTPDERRRMQAHTTIGADTLLAIRARLGDDDLLDMSIQIALEHHEKWDGSGYPIGLAGEHIALPARIVALADVYDALTSRRVYKAAFTHADARAAIEAGRGAHFDPCVVDAFVAVEDRFDQIRRRMHSDPAPVLARAA